MLLSIVIPTKDRYKTLFPVIESLSREFADYNDIEIVIQDNTYNNSDAKIFLDNLNDAKMKYFHNASPIFMNQNCDKAVLNSCGKYIILIGDDDYVLKNIYSCVLYMEDHRIECLNSLTSTYNWPGLIFSFRTIEQRESTLLEYKVLKTDYVEINIQDELIKVKENGASLIGQLPRIYHGLVRRDILDRVYLKTNSYFPGLSPDMASSIALACVSKSLFQYNFPFSISGKSAASASGQGVNHKHYGDLDQKLFLDKDLLKYWNVKIPRYWSGSTIWGQSATHCLGLFGQEFGFNYKALYARIAVFDKSYLKILNIDLDYYIGNKLFDRLYICKSIIEINWKRYFRFFMRKIGYSLEWNVRRCESIDQCY